MVIGSNPIKLKMKLFNKKHKKINIRNFIKKNKLFFFFFNSYLNANEWAFFKQQLKNKSFNFLITSKNQIEKVFYNSIYIHFKALNSQISILLYFQYFFLVSKTAAVPMLGVKLNKHIYHKNQLKNSCSFYYVNNKLLLFKFNNTILKIKSK